MNKEESIIGKVKALLAKADIGSGATEAEATAAAEKAQELMLRYGIELAQIAQAKGENLSIGYETFSGGIDPWRRVLAEGIAQSMGGRTVWRAAQRGKWTGTIDFWGQRGTTAAMIATYQYVEAQLVVISKLEASQVAHVNAARAMSWRRNFLVGASGRVARRLLDRKKTMEDNTDTSMALVVIKDAVYGEMEGHYGGLKKGSKIKVRDAEAYSRGVDAANNVDLGGEKLTREKAALSR